MIDELVEGHVVDNDLYRRHDRRDEVRVSLVGSYSFNLKYEKNRTNGFMSSLFQKVAAKDVAVMSSEKRVLHVTFREALQYAFGGRNLN